MFTTKDRIKFGTLSRVLGSWVAGPFCFHGKQLKGIGDYKKRTLLVLGSWEQGKYVKGAKEKGHFSFSELGANTTLDGPQI